MSRTADLISRCTLVSALLLLIASQGSGCSSPDPNPSERTSVPSQPSKGGRLVQTPPPADPVGRTNAAATEPLVLPTSGRIHSVNSGLQFVVVDYTIGGAPPMQSLVPVYRGNQKVGQLRLTGPERNGFVAADVVEGILQVDDEVRIH